VPVALLATFAVLTLFRLVYYDDWLPNTYYLKVEGVSVATRLVRGFAALAFLQVFHPASRTFVACLYLFRHRHVLRPGEWLLAAVSASLCAYSVWVGGDAWENYGFSNRYLTPAIPFLVLFSARLIELVTSGHESLPRPIVSRLALCLMLVGALNLILIGEMGVIQVFTAEFSIVMVRMISPLIAAGAMLRIARGQTTQAMTLDESASGRAQYVAVGLLLISVNLAPAFVWARDGAPHVAGEDAARSAYGLTLRRTTDPDSSIAVTFAGSVAYFSHRDAVDQLGKSDRLIAKGPAVSDAFYPGHSKWNLSHSIRDLRPDFVAGLLFITEADVRNLEDWGYRQVAGSCFYLTASRKLDIEALRTAIEKLRAEPRFQPHICAPRALAGLF
jgi:hypothetical protein